VTEVFPFPPVEGQPAGLIGGGEMVAAFSDRPEVREMVRFLLSPDHGEDWAKFGIEFMSANRRFDLDNYPPFLRRQAELLEAALAADTFRFDASDLMPPPIGNGVFWDAMITYFDEGPESLDQILAEIDAAWPDDTS
jgi:alpha-glucoside transport system substrate-binding protein